MLASYIIFRNKETKVCIGGAVGFIDF